MIWGEEELAMGLGAQDAPPGPHAGVHDGDKDRARRKIPVRPLQQVGRPPTVARRHVVTQIHHARGGGDAENDPVHHSDKLVIETKIGEERDDGHYSR